MAALSAREEGAMSDGAEHKKMQAFVALNLEFLIEIKNVNFPATRYRSVVSCVLF